MSASVGRRNKPQPSHRAATQLLIDHVMDEGDVIHDGKMSTRPDVDLQT